VASNRTVRLAVLGSSVQRAAARKYPSRSGAAVKRRVVVGVLVLLSLTLITLSFRESGSGGIHRLQGAGATALQPFEIAATRVAQPFRDAYGWASDLVHAKSENEKLEREIRALRHEVIQNETARQENVQLRELFGGYRAALAYPRDYLPIAAEVYAYAPSQFEQRVVIAAGLDDGVRLNDPVIDGDGLVGRVTEVTGSAAQVTLLTDESIAVPALDLDTQAAGLVHIGSAGSETLVLDRVRKSLVVNRGDEIVTAGSQSGELPSFYPKGIRIGKVTYVSQTDTDFFKSVQIEPFVDFDTLDSVIVLAPKRPVATP
jgi:rod shape-determining protein MreC